MMKKKLFCASLAVILAICLASSTCVMAIGTNLVTDAIGDQDEVKVYSNATIEDDFADNRVLVVLTNEASLSLSNYEALDFPEISCNEVCNLTQTATNIVQAELKRKDAASICNVSADAVAFKDFYNFDTNRFNQVLCLNLEDEGKEKVLDAIEALESRTDILYVGPDYAIAPCALPNDTYYGQQWAASKIQLPQAWNITTGSSTVRVGILDSGIDGTHPDLANRINVSLSRDFTYNMMTVVSEVTDLYGHGTAVAGVVAAQGNNGKGITGVAWNVELVSLRTLDAAGNGYSSYVANAINYATSAGIPILNLSSRWYSDWSSYDYALATTISNYPGLFVCAAGNESKDNDVYSAFPASYTLSNLISVGGTTQTDQKASWSNYGKTTVDVFAPGDNILTCCRMQPCIDGECSQSSHVANGYHTTGGTSIAAPFVAGVAALVLSNNPNYTPGQIKQKIMSGVDRVSALTELCTSGGRLNAYKALHNHSYSYTSNNATTHTCVCSCGYTQVESHNWSTVSTIDSLTYVLIRVCTKCGYRASP